MPRKTSGQKHLQPQLMEEALRQSEERFRALIEHSTDVFMILGPDGTLSYRSPTKTGRGPHGHHVEELIGRNAFDFVHPEDRPRMQALLADTVQRPGPSPLAYARIRTFAGSWRVVEVIFNNQLTNPAIVGIICTIHDVTEQKQAEEALRALNETLEQRVAERTQALQVSEERYRDFFDNASDMITTMTADGVLNGANRSIKHYLGYSPKEVLGKNWREFVTPDSVALIEQRLSRAEKETTDSSIYEFEAIHKDGRPIPLEGRIRYIRDEAGALIALHGIFRDITQRKEVDRLKDELVSTISHELRTPLTSMRGFTELLLTREFAPQQRQHMLSIMHQEATRLTALINDFLDLQRMTEGQHPYTFEPLDLDPLLREAVPMFSAVTTQHSFQFDLHASLPLVYAEPNRIRQVLRNLLSNAMKYTPNGGTVSVGARREGAEVVVWIADQGIGIPPEALPKIFTKFFRVDNADTRQIGGTGLGLALVKEIITTHHGRVWVESSVGKGSTFFFTLPLAANQVSPFVLLGG